MSRHLVKILTTNYITRDVKQFVVDRPRNYSFLPGQATDVSVNLPEWKDELRPFTFTGLMEWDYLQFTIKIYKERKSVTALLGQTEAGGELYLHDVFGAIQYKGPGVFIAGGAGITPFIAILRDLYAHKRLTGNRLIFSNKTSGDVILNEELQKMLGNDFLNVFTREATNGQPGKRIDSNFLVEQIPDFKQHFYVCGPDEFVSSITNDLKSLGASPESVIIEK